MKRTIELSNEFPKIVTLCGSTRFKDLFEKLNFIETCKGNIILSVCTFDRDINEDMKVILDILHKQKIDISDEILVIDPLILVCDKCGKPCEYSKGVRCCEYYSTKYINYIGVSTRSEIDYALNCGVKIRYYSKEMDNG